MLPQRSDMVDTIFYENEIVDLLEPIKKRDRAWTAAEDGLLIDDVEKHRDSRGRPSWIEISKLFSARGNDRTPQEARCRYARIRKGRDKRASGQAKNRCKTCGSLRIGHTCDGKVSSEFNQMSILVKAAGVDF